ncbi:putative lipoprotein [Labilithrix luteola]|uniref:Putative lipoprotein n=1 Tax=Labilithrix luteola TaxID=1391654 RepID=A0A0K1Q671_9BACT|nr:ferritin-like domain-containing protein [Labilithrix luteola]AKV01326.1 putative lipoprotein [Labilithrix luteola]
MAAFADEATFACNAPLADILTNLTPKTSIDYIELRTQTLDYSKSPVALSAPTKVASAGTPCKTAADPTQCITALGNAVLPDNPDSVDAGWIPGGNPSYAKPPNSPSTCCINARAFLVVTTGDTVSPLYTTEDVARVFAPIDTLEEARLLASTRTMLVDCAPGIYRAGWKKNEDGSWELLVTFDACASHNRRRVHITVDGTVTVVAHEYQALGTCGRRPAGLLEARQSTASAVAAFVASSAHLEAASVHAFRRLERELVSHDAPPNLVRRARQARRDEIRHARDMSQLAHNLGADVPAVEVTDVGARDLVSIAVENVVEGCTLETYGAIVAAFQAERSAPEHRRLLREIAGDEIRHAELAHDVAAWLDTRLTDEERALVEAARAEALQSLRARLDVEPSSELVTKLGIPTRAEAADLLTGFESRLAMN